MFLVKKRATWDSFWTVCSLTKPIGDKTHLKKKNCNYLAVQVNLAISGLSIRGFAYSQLHFCS